MVDRTDDLPWIIERGAEYDVAILAGEDFEGNADVEVRFHDGRVFTATFFSVFSLESLFRKNKATGEFAGGRYLFCREMIIVEELSTGAIMETVADLFTTGMLDSAFSPLSD